MFFANYRAKYKGESRVMARLTVARGKRRFVLSGSLIYGVLFWLGMNAVQFARHPADLKGVFLTSWEGRFS